MQKSKNLKSWSSLSLFFDVLVALLCAAAAALCIHYFRLDFYQTLSRQNEEPVGIITYKYKAVQRRFVDRLLWDRLQRESPVYNGDFIRTEDLSEATVFFSSGGSVDLAENSLIQIFAEQSIPRLTVSGGGVSVNAKGSDFVLSSGGNTVTVGSGGVVSTRTDADGKMGLWVSEGRAAISTQDGVREASAGSALSLTPEGKEEALPMTAVLSPRPGARLLSRGQSGLSVEFLFNPVNYDGQFTRLEVSASRNFENITTARDLDGNRASVNLTPGVWWWRAYPARKGQQNIPASAAAGKITIINAPPPTLLTPAEDQVFSFKSDYPAVRFRWSEGSGESIALYYLLEVADNPAMENPRLQTQARGSSALYSQLGPGRWYWRVTLGFSSEYEGGAEPSPVSSFAIEQHDVLPAPSLIAPAPGSTLIAARRRDDIWFSWKPKAETGSFTLRISQNQDLSNPVIQAEVKNSYYIYTAQAAPLGEGRYYWGVYGTNGKEDSQLSPVWSFTSEAALGALSPPDNTTVREDLVSGLRFTWKANVPVGSFQISRDAGFSSLELNETVSGETHRIQSLSAGTWYWRVTGGGEQSSAKKLIVSSVAAPQVAAPEPPPRPRFEPPDDFVFRVEHLARQEITFKWNAVAGASGYTFTLLQGEDQRRILSVPVSENSYTLRDLKILSRGPFIWQVTAGGRTVTESRFTINIPEVRRIELRDIGTVFSIRTATEAQVIQRLSWLRDENASSYELILERKDGNDYREVIRKTIKTASTDVPVDRGTYRYKLRIYNLLGQFEYETNWSSFNIILA
ncbi:MAG: hypothetical protein LBQ57_10850 [Spirochaetales bacterium]|jgi:hypothetical protein|nr:hypothetical protein [Spirochaetales bacterium]